MKLPESTVITLADWYNQVREFHVYHLPREWWQILFYHNPGCPIPISEP